MNSTDVTVIDRIAEIWRRVLAAPDLRLAGDDNFFSLGATSMMAMTMVDQLSTEFGIAVSIFAVTENPELEALAEYLVELLQDIEQGEL